ncbi:HNH endonuclease [Acinetobacter baumannii]|uniref:HNH endonuclease n=1 Tax=Acinetobacter baumannii TaxID=470 RepID=UPI0002BA953F|nr:HNH endonuclease [Acinetobacter baumannii]EJG9676518.1 HNH endonuclease [Acinetobacter baumannii]EKU1893388.1 HNH endonuclease [Acinetobacter baumannii]EKU7426679.1 HNH endonuclease [Acinetobacter baumannii]EKV0794682.1 HNH endonuclease [Acinetobacter baumannii]EKV2352215.1 HNH endonuclease [Acinetobacter baumannii]
MSESRNKFGLPRSIPSSIKRDVRKRDNFGCILCALPIIQYEHVDPLYCDAKEHKVEGITLLCPTCHTKVTNGLISKDLIKEAMESPKAQEKKVVSDSLIFTKSHPTIQIGGATFEKCWTILKCKGENIFSITQEDGRYFINAKFWDSKGKQNLTIINNEWQVQTENVWDLEVVGNTVTIREKQRKPSLVFSLTNNNYLTIEKIEMNIKGMKILGNKDILTINSNTYQLVSVIECGTCIQFD